MSDTLTTLTLTDQILDPQSRANPYPLYEKLRERPVWREPDGSFVVGRYDEVAGLIRDPRMSAEPSNSPRGGIGLSFLNMDPPRHDRLRRMTNRHFGPPNDPGRVEAMTPALEVMVKHLIDQLDGKREVDVVAAISYPFPVSVITDLLGVPREDEPRFHAWAEAIVQATDRDPNEPGKRSEGAERAFQELGAYMMGLITARRGAPRDDMLSRLVNDDGPDGAMEPPEMISVAVLLLLAGHETTVNLISNGMLTMLRFPHLLRRLREEPQIAPALVEEVLRYEPPVHFTHRSTLCDIEVGGVTIPKGSSVQLMLASASRDPQRFDNPDSFLPDRPNNQHMGFGSGIHACFGAPLARLEGQIALRELARRLVSPRLLQDPPPYRFNPTLRGPRELRVAIDGIID
jgi:cytochrome P450